MKRVSHILELYVSYMRTAAAAAGVGVIASVVYWLLKVQPVPLSLPSLSLLSLVVSMVLGLIVIFYLRRVIRGNEESRNVKKIRLAYYEDFLRFQDDGVKVLPYVHVVREIETLEKELEVVTKLLSIAKARLQESPGDEDVTAAAKAYWEAVGELFFVDEEELRAVGKYIQHLCELPRNKRKVQQRTIEGVRQSK